MSTLEKIGITDLADAGIRFGNIKKLYRANILITKHLENEDFLAYCIANQDKIILHATITGWGGTEMEPGVKTPEESIKYLLDLIHLGFPINHIVLRCDPIIPNDEGIDRAARTIMSYLNINPEGRIRISTIDGYKHVRERFKNAGIEFPFPYGFNATTKYQLKIVEMVKNILKEFPDAIFESCAETYPATGFIKKVGCISKRDLKILGIDDINLQGSSNQRSQCLCPANKVQLLGWDYKCPSKCKYCYIKW